MNHKESISFVLNDSTREDRVPGSTSCDAIDPLPTNEALRVLSPVEEKTVAERALGGRHKRGGHWSDELATAARRPPHPPRVLLQLLHSRCKESSLPKPATHGRLQYHCAGRCLMMLLVGMSLFGCSILDLQVTSLLPCWWTITKDSSLASIVSSSNMAATSLLFDSWGIDCKSRIAHHLPARWQESSQMKSYLATGWTWFKQPPKVEECMNCLKIILIPSNILNVIRSDMGIVYFVANLELRWSTNFAMPDYLKKNNHFCTSCSGIHVNLYWPFDYNHKLMNLELMIL